MLSRVDYKSCKKTDVFVLERLTFLGSLTMRSVRASLRATLSVVSPSSTSTVVLKRPLLGWRRQCFTIIITN